MTLRFPFLDGLRGLSALYVVLFHASLVVQWRFHKLPGWLDWGTLPFQFGRSAVGVFIVLSGFVLALPLLARETPFDIRGFLKRRLWRILPPYYAAVALGLLVCATPVARSEKDWGNLFQPAFDTWPLLSHLFLIHNLVPERAFTINISLWSLATEVQIYLVFAFLLVPFWKRFGIGATIALSWVLGVGVAVLFPQTRLGSPWYLGLFSLGMLAAQIRVRPETLSRFAEVPWRTAALMAWALFFIGILPTHLRGVNTQGGVLEEAPIYDLLIGIAAMATILAGCEKPTWLERPILRNLGTISFSLYLSHAPLLAIFGWLCRQMNLNAWGTATVMYFAGVPLCLGAAVLFYRAFEGPTQRLAARCR